MIALLLGGLMMTESFVEPGALIEKLPGTYRFTEGACWTKKGTLIFSDIPMSKIYEWDGKEMTVWRDGSNNANGNTIDGEGNVWSCEHGSRSLVVYREGVPTTVAKEFGGKKLNSPNDVAIHSSGRVLFTDPSYGIRPEQMEVDGKYVYEMVPGGELKQLWKGRNQPNGLVFSPDGKRLYVADSEDGGIDLFDYSPGTIKHIKKFDSQGPDGVRVDVDGRVWAACGDGVNVYSADGALLENIKFPEQPSNLCFGGGDGKNLFVTARKGVYSLRVRVVGVRPGF